MKAPGIVGREYFGRKTYAMLVATRPRIERLNPCIYVCIYIYMCIVYICILYKRRRDTLMSYYLTNKDRKIIRVRIVLISKK